MLEDNRVDQGWGRWAGVLLLGAVLLVGIGTTTRAQTSGEEVPGAGAASGGGQKYELEGGGWVKQPTADPGSPEGKLESIRRLIAEDKGKKAKEAADEWIEAYPDHPLIVEAYLLRGDANVARKHYFKSLFDYEYVIREFSGTEQFHTAMEREFELAKLFAGGMNRRLWGMRVLPATGEAEEILVRIQERSPGSDLGEMASLLLADYYFDRPQMDSAAEAYDLFLINYPRSLKREWAMLRLIQANLARFKGPRFDATGLIDAGQRLKTYRAEYPASAERIGVDALLIRIDESLAMRDMVAAGWHVKRKQDLSAIYLYQRVVTDYPQTAAAQDAIRILNEMGAEVLQVDEADPTDSLRGSRNTRPADPAEVTEPTVSEVEAAVEDAILEIEAAEAEGVTPLEAEPVEVQPKEALEPDPIVPDPTVPDPVELDPVEPDSVDELAQPQPELEVTDPLDAQPEKP